MFLAHILFSKLGKKFSNKQTTKGVLSVKEQSTPDILV